MAALHLALLGTFEARLESGPAIRFPRKKIEALLAYLAVHPGRAHARDSLASVLWGETPNERARQSLRQALLTLRQALGPAAPAVLREEGGTIALIARGVAVDVGRFEAFVAEGTPQALEHAIALYRGDFLAGISIDEPLFEEWLRTERERVREVAVEALAKLLGQRVKEEAIEQAVAVGLRLLALEPAQEAVHRTLMRLYARQGRRGAALRQYQLCVGILERELGVEPEAETRRLYRELVQVPAAGAAPAQPRHEPANLTTPHTTLVGRAPELALLDERLADATAHRGAIGVIQGEAGIGKTRLIEAVVQQASDAGAFVLLGRGYESDQVLPLGLWVSALRAAGVAPGLMDALDPPWRTELSRLFPELGSRDRQARTGEDYVRLFEAIVRLIQSLTAHQPLLVVLEDLHWADEMTLRLLVFLGRRLGGSPVLIVGTVRVEDLPDAPMLRRMLAQLARQPRFFSTTLGPLSHAETGAVVRTLIKSDTDDGVSRRLGERVWQASEGNPFMIVEMTRALHGPEAAAALDDVLTPPRVRDLIAARLERLSERARRLAGVASVVGREFDFSLLERAAGVSAGENAEGLEELVARRILHAVGERFDFSHEQIREVTYAGLLAPYRRRLHLAVAHALETLHADDLRPYTVGLGRHYYAGETWDSAARYLIEAGRSAAGRAAHREAAACFEQAVNALEHLPASQETQERIIDLCFDVRQSCVPLADHRRALAHLRTAERHAEAIADRLRLGWTHVYRTHGVYLAGDSRAAARAGEASLAIAESLDAPLLLESANVYAAQVAHWVGDYRRAGELLRRNVTTIEPALTARQLVTRQYVNSRTYLAWCLAELGEFSQALAHADEAMATAEAADNAYWLVHACFGAGLAHLRAGEFDRARSLAERAVDLCNGRDFFVLWAIPAAILGAAHARTGHAGDGIPLLERAAELASMLAAPILTLLAEALLLDERADEAASVAQRAHQLAVDREERGWEAWALQSLADVALAREPNRASTAEDLYRRAMIIADELGMRPLMARCHLGLGTMHLRAGKRPIALEHLDMASTIFGATGMAWWLRQAHEVR